MQEYTAGSILVYFIQSHFFLIYKLYKKVWQFLLINYKKPYYIYLKTTNLEHSSLVQWLCGALQPESSRIGFLGIHELSLVYSLKDYYCRDKIGGLHAMYATQQGKKLKNKLRMPSAISQEQAKRNSIGLSIDINKHV